MSRLFDLRPTSPIVMATPYDAVPDDGVQEIPQRGRSDSLVFSGMPLLDGDEMRDRDGTLFSSVITLSMTAAGAGILALPIALKNAGLIGGLVTLFLSALAADHSCILLARADARFPTP